LVVGLGLIGGSLAAAARVSGGFAEIRGVEREPEVRRHALRRGLIEGAGELAGEVPRADMIVLAVPVSEIVRLLPVIGRLARPGAVVTDVGSTKRRIVEAMNALPEAVRALGGHPMAGTTRSGPDAWDGALFRGARWATVPTLRTDVAARARVRALIAAVGARAVEMDARTHDRMVAITSHLPALLSVGLCEAAREQADAAGVERLLVGPGFRSATRLAESAPDLLGQLFRENRDYLAEAVTALDARVREIQALMRGTGSELERRLDGARRARAALCDDDAG
jgi:prephenate dehydrogenase